MYSSLIAGTSVTVFPITGLLIFFTFALAIVWWAYHPKRKVLFERLGSMALDGQDIAPQSQKKPSDFVGENL